MFGSVPLGRASLACLGCAFWLALACVFSCCFLLGAAGFYPFVVAVPWFWRCCCLLSCLFWRLGCLQATRWLSWYGVDLASADRLPVVVRIPAGPLGSLKCDPPKGNGRRPKKKNGGLGACGVTCSFLASPLPSPLGCPLVLSGPVSLAGPSLRISGRICDGPVVIPLAWRVVAIGSCLPSASWQQRLRPCVGLCPLHHALGVVHVPLAAALRYLPSGDPESL